LILQTRRWWEHLIKGVFIAILAHSASKFSKNGSKAQKAFEIKRGIKNSVFYTDFKIVEKLKKSHPKKFQARKHSIYPSLISYNFLGDFFVRVLYQRKHLRFLNRILVDKLRFRPFQQFLQSSKLRCLE
jgi:hypothetical protein